MIMSRYVSNITIEHFQMVECKNARENTIEQCRTGEGTNFCKSREK